MGFESQDYFLLGIDRTLLSDPNCTKGFILTAKTLDNNNIVFDAYLDFVDDMYSIGHIDLDKDMEGICTSRYDISKVENVVKSLNLQNSETIYASELAKLLDTEQWFIEYLTQNRWSFDGEHYFDKRELDESIKMYKAIVSTIYDYELINTSTFGE